MKSANIGINVPAPEKKCEDKNCPFHGNVKVRGRTMIGKVINSKIHVSITVEQERTTLIPKYERYQKKRTRVHAHNPYCIDAKEGDTVKIMECRPLSKTKRFVVVEKVEEKK